MIKKLLIIFILLSLPTLAQEGSFSLTLFTEDGNLELENLELVQMEPPVYLESEIYELRAHVMSFKGEELETFDLSLDMSATDGGPELQRGYMNFLFPHYREAKEVVIKNKETNEVVLTVDLSEFQLCNFDEFCDFDETVDTCPEDCKEIEKGDVIRKAIKKELERPEEKEEVSEEKVEKKSKLGQTLLIVIVIIVVLGFIIGLIIKRKRKTTI